MQVWGYFFSCDRSAIPANNRLPRGSKSPLVLFISCFVSSYFAFFSGMFPLFPPLSLPLFHTHKHIRSCSRSGRDEAPHTLFGNRAAARLSLGRPQEALEDAETAIQKDGKWLKGYHRKACAHQAMGERGVALETYRHALEIEPKNRWLQEQVRLAKAEVVSISKVEPIESFDAWITVFESMSDSRERLSTLAHLWNQCQTKDRRVHEIFGQFLSLIAGAGTQHTGVKPEHFTEEMMVSLPMDNYDDLKASPILWTAPTLQSYRSLSSVVV
ncbi:unnamed protein product [Pylaiella littoralis]